MTKKLYLVLTISDFNTAITRSDGLPLNFPPSPKFFCPVFTNRKEAIKWANGREDLVKEVEREVK